jgi:hypothetical protein
MPNEMVRCRCTLEQAEVLSLNVGKLVDVGPTRVKVLPVVSETINNTDRHDAAIEHVPRRTEGEMATEACKNVVVALFWGAISKFVRYG